MENQDTLFLLFVLPPYFRNGESSGAERMRCHYPAYREALDTALFPPDAEKFFGMVREHALYFGDEAETLLRLPEQTVLEVLALQGPLTSRNNSGFPKPKIANF